MSLNFTKKNEKWDREENELAVCLASGLVPCFKTVMVKVVAAGITPPSVHFLVPSNALE